MTKSTYPLSVGQQALFLLNQSSPECMAYNLACVASLRSGLDIDALKTALWALFDKNDVFRTTLSKNNGNLLQQVCEREKIHAKIEEYNVTTWSPESLREQILKKSFSEYQIIQRPFMV